MKQAIISDLHSNIEALNAVLADLAKRHPDEIVCLGDVVGYGPDPEEAIDTVEKQCRFCLSGNHDYAVLTRAERFNPLAEEAADYTRDVLRPGLIHAGRKRARWTFLEKCPTRVEADGNLYVHGSPRDDRNEYILESDVVFGNIRKIEEVFDLVPRLLFVGHSHVPGIIGPDRSFWHPEDTGVVYELDPEAKYIINVGSVGQPRDGDNRSCYVILEGNKITYYRVPYAFEKTMRKMERVGPISKEAAERLACGR